MTSFLRADSDNHISRDIYISFIVLNLLIIENSDASQPGKPSLKIRNINIFVIFMRLIASRLVSVDHPGFQQIIARETHFLH